MYFYMFDAYVCKYRVEESVVLWVIVGHIIYRHIGIFNPGLKYSYDELGKWDEEEGYIIIILGGGGYRDKFIGSGGMGSGMVIWGMGYVG